MTTLTLDEIRAKLIDAHLGRRTQRAVKGGFEDGPFMSDHVMVGKHQTGFTLWAKSEDPRTGERIKKILKALFAEAENVVVEEGVVGKIVAGGAGEAA